MCRQQSSYPIFGSGGGKECGGHNNTHKSLGPPFKCKFPPSSEGEESHSTYNDIGDGSEHNNTALSHLGTQLTATPQTSHPK